MGCNSSSPANECQATQITVQSRPPKDSSNSSTATPPPPDVNHRADDDGDRPQGSASSSGVTHDNVMRYDDDALDDFDAQHTVHVREQKEAMQRRREEEAAAAARAEEQQRVEEERREADYKQFEAEREQEHKELLAQMESGVIQDDLLVLDC